MRGLASGIVLILLLCTAACGGGAEPTIVPLATPTLALTAIATAAPTSSAIAEPETIVYIVKPGDTLGAIADKFGTTVEAIVEANDIKDPHFIKDGQELVIPRP